MLDEFEWKALEPHLTESLQEIKRFRQMNGASIEEARAAGFDQAALHCYFQLTGYRETNPDNLWRYRRANYGDLCRSCGKPLRTPASRLCAECGVEVQ